MSARDHAVEAAADLGWHVFRVHVGHDEAKCDGGTASCKKLRFLDAHWSRASSADPEVVGAWDWSGANAYGIDCGRSGIFVVDVDPGGEWGDGDGTRVHTTGRGRHLVYDDLLGLPSGTGLRPGVDTRGVGGLVIGPGSFHPHGAYEVARDVAPAPLPPELVAAVLAHDRRPAPRQTPAYDGPAYADLTAEQRALADERARTTLFDWAARLAGVARWPEGQRDERGRGWETMSRDLAWAVAVLVATPWGPPVDGQAEFERALPQALLADPVCAAKWRDDLPAKAAAAVGPPPWLDPVFDATTVLRHVRQAAHSRLVGSRALLLAVLARVALEVPVTTVLPPVRGSAAQLNLGVALVGGSGSGKSAVFEVSREVLGLVGLEQRGANLERVPGSGEGLAETYLEPTRGRAAREMVADPRRLFWVDEIGQLGAMKDGRAGATLGPVLRTLLTGGTLGSENATAERRRHVPSGSYRAALVAGVQPVASDVLLNAQDVGTGTPQRFAWALVADPTIGDDDVPWPGPLEWRPPARWPAEVAYPDEVRDEVRRRARAAARGEDVGDGLDGHARLTRLKVAALLAVLHGEVAVTDLWWRLAGTVAGEWTTEAQAACRAALGESRDRQAAAAGRQRGRSRVAEEGVVAQDRARRDAVTAKLLAVAAEGGDEGVGWSAVRNALRSTQRAAADHLVGSVEDPGPLVESGQLRLEAVEYRGQAGLRLHLGGAR